jgi:glycogen operon protein
LRKAHPVLSAERFYTDAEIAWIGPDGRPPDWHGRENRIGCVLADEENGVDAKLCLLFNAALRPARFLIPPASNGSWRIAVDTAKDSRAGPPGECANRSASGEIVLAARSTVILLAP